MTRYHVGIASNINPATNFPAAVAKLAAAFELIDSSPIYRTAPIGRPDQGHYHNGVVALDADFGPPEFRLVLRAMETAAGRVRTGDRYAARELDLDILLVDGEPVDETTAKEIGSRPWNAWALHWLNAWPAPAAPEPPLAVEG